MKRAIRRHHRKRQKRKVKWYYGGECAYCGGKNPTPWNDDECGKIIKRKAPCSNPWCCGNPRRLRGAKKLTRQEEVSKINKKEQEDEM